VLRSTRVRLYSTLRTAHLERAHRLSPAAIVYLTQRYDFDESLTEGLELVRTSPLGAAVLLARSPVDVLEINEPLMVQSLRMTALAVAAVRVRGALTRRRTAVVSYAIGNQDPWSGEVRAGLRPAVARWLERRLAAFVWRRVDRICFGTAAAREVYRQALPPARPIETLIPALPVRVDGKPEPEPGRVVFLGAFSERKGIDRLLAAWPLVRRAIPEARLQVLGKGALEAQVRAAAAADGTMSLMVDPARPVILDELGRAQVLVLASQPTPSWREQVGLPIVEGLASGCSIVTTSETGLASWLAEHGHAVIAPGSPPDVLAGAIVEQLAARRSFAEVTDPLPATDGRLDADGWLFGE
jgi:glycosyltransferase involved in cell wall biosynthesis